MRRAAGEESQLGEFDRGVVADAGEVVVEEGAEFRATGFAEKDEAEFHGALPKRGRGILSGKAGIFDRFAQNDNQKPNQLRPYFLRLSRSVLRLMPRISAALVIL